MREALLHYIWKYKKYPITRLKTTAGDAILVSSAGDHNQLSGPDFFNSKLQIAQQVWAGNVEIHIKSSDWYAHNHEQDVNYDNVILHVVWEDDVSVFRADGSEIPTLELKNFISKELLHNYRKLFEGSKDKSINCQSDINGISKFTLNNWLERLYFERLEQKSQVILALLESSKNDWEKVLFILLFKNFGSKINGDLFFNLGKDLDFAIVRKLYNKPKELESLFLGLAGLLKVDEEVDPYLETLQSSFDFLKHKYELSPDISRTAAFFKLRPLNFPTIRLSQFATLYAANNTLFQNLMELEGQALYDVFEVKANTYWETHFTFGKTSNKRPKTISKKFVDLLIINTILPLKFCYQKYHGIPLTDSFTREIEKIAKEDNSIIKKYLELGLTVTSAKDSQAFLQLYTNYCSKNNCLQCAVGAALLNIKS